MEYLLVVVVERRRRKQSKCNNNNIEYIQLSLLKILDEALSSPGLHAAAGPGLAEECATLVQFL